MKLPGWTAALAACLLPLAALAANPIDGTWTGRFAAPGADGGKALFFVLKADGERLAGSIEGDGGPVPVASGWVRGGQFEFKVTVGGAAIEHAGTVEGDAIAMTIANPGQPPIRVRLSRIPAAVSAADPSGFWAWTVVPDGGRPPVRICARLSYAGGRLTGDYYSRTGDAPISDGTLKDGTIGFSVVRTHDGKPYTVKYKGVFSGDAIEGTIELPGYDTVGKAFVAWTASRPR